MSLYLAKYIASAGVCSRRNAIMHIKEGIISVNGVLVNDPAYIIKEGDVIRIRNRIIKPEEYVYILLNKPKGYITTTVDENERNTVLDLIKPKIKERIYPVGRLDQDSTGLLILTNDGALAQHLAHPRYEVSKIYQVTLDALLHIDHEIQIKNGVCLRDGIVNVDSLKVLNKARTRVKVQLHSGKNRIIRRLFKHIGYHVLDLDRIAYADLSKKGLSVGRWRYLTRREIADLKQSFS